MGLFLRFFSNLVGEEGPRVHPPFLWRVPGIKDSRVCFLKS
jgi:hypothetical protein